MTENFQGETVWREPADADVPAVGPTGSHVARWDITIHNRDERYRYDLKLPPTSEVDVYDDDGDRIGTRERTASEMTAIMVAYEKHVAEYKRTGGVLVRERAPDFTLAVECDDGSRAKADWLGDEWRWTEVS